MTTFTFSRDHEDASDLARDLAQFRRATSRGDRLRVDVETKRAADAEIGRRIQALADAKEIGFDQALPLFFERATPTSNSDDSTLVAISAAGVLTMVNHPAVGGRA